MKIFIGLMCNVFFIGELGGGQVSCDIVCWAFNVDVGEVFFEFYGYQDLVDYYINKYVVVGFCVCQVVGLFVVVNIKS